MLALIELAKNVQLSGDITSRKSNAISVNRFSSLNSDENTCYTNEKNVFLSQNIIEITYMLLNFIIIINYYIYNY